MRAHLHIVYIVLIMLASHGFTGRFTYVFANHVKQGTHLLPIFGTHIENQFLYIALGVVILAPIYSIGGILLFNGHALSSKYFGVLYPSVIANIIVFNFTTIYYMYIKAGELPNRWGWLAILFLTIGGILSALANKLGG